MKRGAEKSARAGGRKGWRETDYKPKSGDERMRKKKKN